MPRIRSIKPEFFTSEDVSSLPMRARLTWIGLWLHCDDHGRTKDKVKLIKAVIWPLDNVSLRDVEEDLSTLAAAGRIVRYEVDGNPLLAVVNWHFHQSINRPGRPKFPAPPVPMKTPAPDEPGHCLLCWTLYMTHVLLSEPSGVDNSNVDVSAGQDDSRSLTDDSLSPHGGLTLGGERKGRGKEGRGTREDGPPARCPRHLDNPTSAPCHGCGEARGRFEQWTVEQNLRRSRCQFCDGDGFRYMPGRRLVATPYIRCDHSPPEQQATG